MYRTSFPKADALPGCATPRHPQALRFAGVSTQALTAVRGNGWQNEARTGASSPEYLPNLAALRRGIEMAGGL